MLQFMIGVILGGVLGFGICAFWSLSSMDRPTKTTRKKEIGDSDA